MLKYDESELAAGMFNSLGFALVFACRGESDGDRDLSENVVAGDSSPF